MSLSKILLLILCLANNFATNAQSIITTGKIVSEKKPLELATISVLDSTKKQLLKSAISDSFGNWQLELKAAGNYVYEISRVGFVTQIITATITNEGKKFETVELMPNLNTNKEVVVTSKKQLIEVKAGKMIVNVDASPSNSNATVLDVLEKSPGISIDKDGNISLKGKQGVVVMIDKRPTYLSAQDLTNMLKSMPSNQLDQIEIISQPGSNYDAAGNSGIINLKMKKNKAKGSNGSITAGLTQGFYLRNNQAITYNYKNKKINIFTNISHDYNKRTQTLSVDRFFVDPITKTPLSRFFQDADQIRDNNYSYAKVGLDYLLDSNNIIGFVTETNISNGSENWINKSDIFNNSNVLLSKASNTQSTSQKNKNLSVNLNWRKTISKTANLFADLDFIGYNNSKLQNLNTVFYDNAGLPTGKNDVQLGKLPSKINIYLAKIDYEKTFAKGQKLEAGAKTSFVKTNNDAGFFLLKNNNWEVDKLRTNNFDYSENINAAYVTYAFTKGKKWEFSTGLRAEQTVSKGIQKINDSSFTKNYLNIFPTIFASYKINEKQNLSVSFGRRVQRPDYEDLNPFRFYLDQYTYELGNVFLQPHFAYNTELNYSMLGGALNHTLGYSFINKAMTDILEQNEQTNETYITKKNIANKRNINYSISFNAPVTKWYTTSIYAETNFATINGNLNGTNEKINIRNLMFNINNQFKISKTIKADIGGFYRPKGNEDLILISQMFAVNAGASKTILKGKATIKLSFRDILNTQKFTANIKYGTVDTRLKQWNDRQTMGLSFSYRFSKGIKFQTAKKKEKSDDEKNRVK
ncbi:MAG: outer membrane beta-barrel family protein [Ferruginibacter sp.]|nr:TonB-dependent receptor [Ferruginibacter sp.]